MVSYAAGSRYLSLIGGVCMSFYDWYCDLPPASPQVWGEQTDVPESADWFNSSFIIAWGSNVPQTRTPDAHFFTEVRYKGTKTVAVTPDYSEVAKLADLWMHPKQGTDAAVAMAMGHVILKEFYFPGDGRERSAYFDDYVRRFTDMPMLVMLKEHTLPSGQKVMVPDRYIRASDFNDKHGQANNPEWKTVAFDESGKVVLPNGAIGFRWGPDGRADQGQWNLEAKEARQGHDVKLKLSVLEGDSPSKETAKVGFPYFGGIAHEHFQHSEHGDVLLRTVLAGRAIVYEPSALVRHHHRPDDAGLRSMAFDYGIGLSALFVKHLTTDPQSLLAIGRRLPAGLRLLLAPDSTRNANRRAAHYPTELTLRELLGIAAGPLAFARSAGRRLRP